jgi:N-acetylneuraminate synthase
VVTIRPVAQGEEMDAGNLWVKRPGTGEIRARDYDRVLGRRAARDLPAGAQVRWRDLEGGEP